MRILGNVKKSDITRHAAEEVRAEERRLQELSRKTEAYAKEHLAWYTKTGEEL